MSLESTPKSEENKPERWTNFLEPAMEALPPDEIAKCEESGTPIYNMSEELPEDLENGELVVLRDDRTKGSPVGLYRVVKQEKKSD